MPRAEIFLEDSDTTPGADVRFVFVGVFDASSPAHQLCNILRAHLDKLAANGALAKIGDAKDFGDMGAANEHFGALDEAAMGVQALPLDEQPAVNDERAGTLVA